MKNYKLLYLPEFYDDLNETMDYITNVLDNRQAADDLLSEIEKAIQSRRTMPLISEPVVSQRDRKNVYYRIYVKNYIVYYVVRDDKMMITRLIYGARDQGKLI